MNPGRRCPGLEELNAYIDGELDDARRATLEAHLASCPEDAQRVAAYRRGDEALRAAFDELRQEEPPLERISRPVRRRRRARLMRIGGVAASVTAVVATLVFGAWWLRESGAPGEASSLARDAASAYRLYTMESVRGLAAQAARERDELSRWLSERVGRPMRVPDLHELGYRLVNVRLLPGAATPAAQLVYQHNAGHKVACYFVARSGTEEEVLRYARDGSVQTFYRLDENLGYAVSGKVGRRELRAVAEAAYRASEDLPFGGGSAE